MKNYNIDIPLKALIDLKAFRYNMNFIRKKNPDSIIILPVKANAYGHGDIIISKEAERIGIEYLAIARLEEGIKLRENKIKLPIINLGVEFSRNIEYAIENRIELSVSSMEHIKEIEAITKIKKKKIPIHLKIDTGMARLGCDHKNAEILAGYIIKSKYLNLKSIYTHFAKSEEDFKFTKFQVNLFLNIKNKLADKNIIPEFYHLYNSGSILLPPFKNNGFAIRPGIMSYGYSPFKNKFHMDLKPVMTLKSRIINIKEIPKGSGISYGHTFITKKPTIIATIPLGYGDGFPRILSNKFMVTINNNSRRGESWEQIMMP